MQPWPLLLAACRLLAVRAHFTRSSTPLALICVAPNILLAGINWIPLLHPVWWADGLHGPKSEDLVFQIFSSGMIGVGKYWAVRGHWQCQARWTKWWCCIMVCGWADTWLGWQMEKNWSTIHCGTLGRWRPGVIMMRCAQLQRWMLPAASLKNWTAQWASSKDPANNVKVKEWPGINQVNYSTSC